jgi:hypothetical protein
MVTRLRWAAEKEVTVAGLSYWRLWSFETGFRRPQQRKYVKCISVQMCNQPVARPDEWRRYLLVLTVSEQQR